MLSGVFCALPDYQQSICWLLNEYDKEVKKNNVKEE
jgi:hypothetical protein